MTNALPIEQCVADAVARYAKERGPLLEILHHVQEQLGCVPTAAVPLIADALNLSRADVHGVVSFYHYFRRRAPGQFLVRLCRAEACQSMQARELELHVKRVLGIAFGETTADGRVTLEPVYCLGLCACAPAMAVNDEVHGRMSAAKFDDIAREWNRT